MYDLGRLFETPRGWMILGAIIFGILMTNACHEGGHAFAAWCSGDRRQGLRRRVTLNPIVHFHWFLTLVMPVLSIWLMGWVLGGARPVLIDAGRIGPRRMALVALAGPAGNFLFAGFLIGALGFVLHQGWVEPLRATSTVTWRILMPVIWFSVLLGLINLIPFPPLDGSRVVGMFLPEKARYVWYMLAPLGLVAFILCMLWLGGAAASWGWGAGRPDLFLRLEGRLNDYAFEMKDFWDRVL